MTADGGKASRDDLIRSATIPGFGIVVGLLALWRNQIQRGLVMMLLSAVVLFAVVMVARSGILITAMRGMMPGKTSVEKELAKVARTITADCPKMLNADTRLDKAIAGPGRKLTFYYSFPKYDSSHVPAKLYSEKVAATQLQEACHAQKLQPFFQNNISLVYRYSAKDGEAVGSVVINRETCGIKAAG
jgi:hypothetical protein